MKSENPSERFSPYRGRESLFRPNDTEATKINYEISQNEANYDCSADQAILTQRPNGEDVITLREQKVIDNDYIPVNAVDLNQQESTPVASSTSRSSDPRPSPALQLLESQVKLKNRFSGRDITNIGHANDKTHLNSIPLNSYNLPEKPEYNDSDTDESDYELLEELFVSSIEESPESLNNHRTQTNEASNIEVVPRKSRNSRLSKAIGKLATTAKKNRYYFWFKGYEEPGESITHYQALRSTVITDIETYTKQLDSKRSEHTEISYSKTTVESSIKIEPISHDHKKTEKVRNWFRKKTVQASAYLDDVLEKARENPRKTAVLIGGFAVAATLISYKFGFTGKGTVKNSELANGFIDFVPSSTSTTTNKGEEFYNWFSQHYSSGISRQQFETIINSQEFKTMCENPEQFAEYIGRV